jgi:hypothetical protein
MHKEDLSRLLEGKSIKAKIIFQSAANKLCDLFWFLSDPRRKPERKIINNTKVEIVSWICKNFQYIKANKIRDFDIDNVSKCILTQSRICKAPIPNIEMHFN